MACGYNNQGLYVCDAGTNVSGINNVASMNQFMNQNQPVNTFNRQGQMLPYNPPAKSWFADTWDKLFGGGNNVIPLSYNPAWGIEEEAYNKLTPLQQQEFALKQQELDALNNFDWKGWTNVGLSGLDTVMKLGMYPTQKDYLENANDALSQNTRIAQEQWDEKQKTRNQYGSAFSNA